ncbi:hypothetical protein [Phenylobacterium conjunctum]|uniref:Uncharacterized protein n=1 Tax=Phenylobacterium conjunctum TaxID=1298959 RepID=A0ABW3T5P5_9CAUL
MRLEAASSAQRMLELLALGRAGRTAAPTPPALPNTSPSLSHGAAATHRAAPGLSSATLGALIHLQTQPETSPGAAPAQPTATAIEAPTDTTEPAAQDEAVDSEVGLDPVNASETDDVDEAGDLQGAADSECDSELEDAEAVTASDETEDTTATSSADEAESLETAWDDEENVEAPAEMTAGVQTTAHLQPGAMLAAQSGAAQGSFRA